MASGISFRTRYIEVAVLAGAGLLLLAFTRLPNVPLCFIRYATGHDCPTCGTTRSLWNILHGNFAMAWRFNPIGYVVAAVLVRRIVVLIARHNVRVAQLFEHRIVDYGLLAAFFAGGTWKMLVSR